MTNEHRLSPVWIQGRTSRQAHADLPEGTYERELGREGFTGAATHMYHRHPPTGWNAWEGPLQPRAFDLNGAAQPVSSPFESANILGNAHVSIDAWRLDASMDHLVRNADGDWLLFVHQGRGDLFCDYGHLAVAKGDYLVIPRGTMWRLEVSEPLWILLVEASQGSLNLPDKGLLGRHAIFDPALLEIPSLDDVFIAQQSEEPWRISVKKRDVCSTVTYPFNPLDAVGWTGDLAPVRVNIRDIRPIMSHRYHVPPSAHSTFVSDRFSVCTFVPRPFETDPGALKVPFFHNNDDYDEVIFYHAGDFFSRDNIDAGMLTFHPSGFTHGPHPGALENMLEQSKPATDEYAVMIDARDPLEIGEAASANEIASYAQSWRA